MKYSVIVSLIITSVLLLSGCSGLSIRTSIEIDAPQEKVYAILADLKAYPEWNPYHRSVTGDFEVGAELDVDIERPDGKQVNIPPHILKIEENREITWGGGIKGIFYGEHRFILSTTDHGSTLVKHDEDFSGMAINFADLPPDVIADGYRLMNEALKKRAESAEK